MKNIALIGKRLIKFSAILRPNAIVLFVLISIFFFVNAVRTEALDSNSAFHTWAGAETTDIGALSGWLEASLTQILGEPGGNVAGVNNGVQKGALYQVAALSDGFYEQRPASAIIWAMDQYNQVLGYQSITAVAAGPNDSPTYFPGLGFDLLRPILGFWQWTRNIAYAFFIIILVVIAFLILFRQSLGGQEIVTVANSLPSILISLVLITFSYPLSAFFIDLVTIGSNFLQSVMITAEGSPGGSIQDLSGGISENTEPNLKHLQPDDPQMGIFSIWGTSNANICADQGCKVISLIPEIPDPTISNFVGGIAELLGNGLDQNGLIRLLLSLIALTASFKLFLALLNNYIILTTMPIFSPFIFLVAALPDRRSSVIGNYFKTLLAASLIFIIVYGVFLFLVLVGNSEDLTPAFQQAGTITWVPPLIGYASTDGTIQPGLYKTIIVYGLFLFTPSIADLVKNNLGVPTGNVFFQTIAQRTQANYGFLQGVRKTAAAYAPGGGGE